MRVTIQNNKGELLDIMYGDDDSEEMHNILTNAILNALSTRPSNRMPTEGEWVEELWDEQDAYDRISQAKVGSLVDDNITLPYLTKLRGEVSKWLGQIDEAIYTVGDESPSGDSGEPRYSGMEDYLGIEDR